MSTEIDKQIDDNQELNKQRRNVMVTATIIILIWFVGIKVTHINLGVTGLTFENSERLFYLLEVVLGYFLFRYFLLFQEVKSIKNPKIYKQLFDTLNNQIIDDNSDLLSKGDIGTNANFEKQIARQLKLYLDEEIFLHDDLFYSFQVDGEISPTEIKVSQKIVNTYYKNIIKNEIRSGVGIMNYILPMAFATATILMTTLYHPEPKKKVVVSFKDNNTSIQIQDYCADRLNKKSLEYKMCVKEIEKKLY